MADKFKPNQEITLTLQLSQQVRQQLHNYDKQLQISNKQFDSSYDTEYFILSLQFIRNWQQFAKTTQISIPDNSNITVKIPDEFNKDLIKGEQLSFGEVQLDSDKKQGIDYIIINQDTMNVFKAYKGTLIIRKAYFNGVQKMVERFPIKFQYTFISHSWINLLQQSDSNKLSSYTGLAYKNQTILDLLYRLIEYSKKDPRNRSEKYINKVNAKIYVSRFQGSLDKYSDEIRKISKQSNLKLIYLDQPGQQLRKDMMIGDLMIPEDYVPILIIDLQQESFIYKSQEQENQKLDFCQFCRKRKALQFPCKCKQANYCSKQCQQRDWRYHSKSCQSLMEQDKEQPQFNILQNSRRGLVGLKNLGNTCYMNSALQCIIHTTKLTQYFRHKLYVNQINQDNPIGSKGKVIRSYAKLIQSVLVTTQDSVAPYKFKYAIGKSKQMFYGYEQHDSQQFLLYVLDTLHQDLNRVIKKPYTNCVQNQDRPDYEVAKQSWLTYLKRNQSYINDIMGGQYRSEVKCPDCNNISVTFDPFLIFSVPIPSSHELKTINLYLFYHNYNKDTLKMTVSSKNNIVRELKEDIINKTKASFQEMKFFILGFNGSIRVVSDDETVDKIINQKQFNQSGQERQLFCLQMSQQELQNYQNKKHLVFKFIDKYGKALTFKRPFPFDCQKNITGSDLYDRICKFLLPLERKGKPKLTQEQMKMKYMVFREKVLQQKKFEIRMSYGNPTEVTNKLTYPQKMLITQQTNITQLLTVNNYVVEFEVEFSQNPYYSFNSFTSYGGHYQGYSSYNHKTGFDQSYTLEECFDQMKISQKLVQGNQVFCSNCHDLKLAEKKMELYKASDYLIIQLRRFKQIGYQKSKNYAQVKYPLYLDLKEYMLNYHKPQAYFADDDIQDKQQFYYFPAYSQQIDISESSKYRLYGVVNHSGSLTGGHYTAYGRHENQWYEFDDSYVRKLQNEGWNSGSSAYLLFYERLKENEQSNKNDQMDKAVTKQQQIEVEM